MQIFVNTGRAPEKSFNFPAKVCKDNRKKSGEMRRFCLHEWFHDYKFLAYSKSSDGLFCLACTFFPMAAHQGSRAKLFISQPYQNWKDARSNLSHHAVLQYHKDSMEASKALFLVYKIQIDVCLFGIIQDECYCKTRCGLRVFKMKIDYLFLKIPIVFSSLFRVTWTISSKYQRISAMKDSLM